jgi:hypothetical protein
VKRSEFNKYGGTFDCRMITIYLWELRSEDLFFWSYYFISMQKGIPVKWTIKADEDELNGCNNAIVIPKLNIEVSFQVGDNIVEFTAHEAGEITYTCWMGMIKSKIHVVDELE